MDSIIEVISQKKKPYNTRVIKLDLERINKIVNRMKLVGKLEYYNSEGKNSKEYIYVQQNKSKIEIAAKNGNLDAKYLMENTGIFVKDSVFVRNVTLVYNAFKDNYEETLRNSQIMSILEDIRVRVIRKAIINKDKSLDELNLNELQVLALMEYDRVSRIRDTKRDKMNFSNLRVNMNIFNDVDYDKVREFIKVKGRNK